jgi:ABC-2 type transport system ATP-binding protein
LIELHQLSKKFGDFYAVRNVNLKVFSGEIFGFLGPNGAGKTTTIRMMVGLVHPTCGRVILGGRDMAREPEVAKSILGFIPDRPYLYEKLTGQEFLEFIADLYHSSASDQRGRRITKLLNFFELEPWSGELIESYSNGMRQRLIIAAALLHRPSILIVDEPLVGLDPRGALLIKRLFRSLAQSGVAIFMSTHTLQLAEELCNRIAIIHQGEIIALGTMQELKLKAQGEENQLESLFLRLTGQEEIPEVFQPDEV